MGWWDNVQNVGQTAINQAGDGISQVGDWLANKTKTFHTNGYDIDPNAYIDPNAAANKTNWGNAGAAAQGRGGPTIATAPQNQFRSGEMGLISALQAQANGQGPSIADFQNEQATQRNLSSAAALQSSARGMNPALQARALQDQFAGVQRDAANSSIGARMQEQQNARQDLIGALAQARGEDIGLATSQANIGLQQGGLNDEMARYYAGLSAQTDQSSFAAQQAQQQLGVQNALGAAQINAGAAAAKDNFWSSLAGAGLAAGGAVGAAAATPAVGTAAAAASDRRLKTDVQPGGKDIYDFLDALHARDYRYKDPTGPGAAPGPQTGVMAQDLEKSKVGRQIVNDTPAGKMVDTSHGLTTALAAMSNLHERMKALEQGRPASKDDVDDDAKKKQRAPTKSIGRKVMDWIDNAEPMGEPANAGVGG